MLTADYDLTAEDVCAFNLHHTRHSPTVRREYLLGWFVPAIAGFFLCAAIWYFADRVHGTPLKTFRNLLPLFLGVPLYLVLFPWNYRRKVRAIVKAMVKEGTNRGLFSRHHITLTPAGIEEVSEQGSSATPWPVVERIVVTDKHAFIYINALAAVIIPRRAFADPAQFAAFVRTAQEDHRAANSRRLISVKRRG
jgi:hypothetical protein